MLDSYRQKTKIKLLEMITVILQINLKICKKNKENKLMKKYKIFPKIVEKLFKMDLNNHQNN